MGLQSQDTTERQSNSVDTENSCFHFSVSWQNGCVWCWCDVKWFCFTEYYGAAMSGQLLATPRSSWWSRPVSICHGLLAPLKAEEKKKICDPEKRACWPVEVDRDIQGRCWRCPSTTRKRELLTVGVSVPCLSTFNFKSPTLCTSDPLTPSPYICQGTFSLEFIFLCVHIGDTMSCCFSCNDPCTSNNKLF